MLRRQIMHQLHGVERGEEKHLLSVESLATSEEKVLLVEMEFSRGVAREASWWPTYGRIRSSGKICCQSKIKGLSLVQLCPSVKEVSLVFIRPRTKASVQKFCATSLVHVCSHPAILVCSWLRFCWCYAWAQAWSPGGLLWAPGGCQGHVAAMETEHVNEQGKGVLLSEREPLLSRLYYLRLGKE